VKIVNSNHNVAVPVIIKSMT